MSFTVQGLLHNLAAHLSTYFVTMTSDEQWGCKNSEESLTHTMVIVWYWLKWCSLLWAFQSHP